MITKDNTLYLPIKKVFFDQIVNGTKKAEYREVKYGITANRYLIRDAYGNYVPNPACTDEDEEYYIDDYNNGQFPFLPKQYKYLYLAVGYSKERDTALIEVESITFEPGQIRGSGDKKFTFWIIVYHLGKIMNIHFKS